MEKIKEEKLLLTNRRWADSRECSVDYYYNNSSNANFKMHFS